MWIWQQQNWPKFTWDPVKLSSLLREANLHLGLLLGKSQDNLNDKQQLTLDTLLANIIHSSAIEGEKLNAFSVRSSLANKLGVKEERPFPTSTQTDGLAEITLDAVMQLNTPLTLARILDWHRLLFPEGHSILNPIEGGVLRGDSPMQVVSGRIDKPAVHFEAPPRHGLDLELSQFIDWFNDSKGKPEYDPIIRAAISHLWFVTLHPLDDGNGRICRLLTDLALAQGQEQSILLFAMSVTILHERSAYYQILEQTQKSDLDITLWLEWFVTILIKTLADRLQDIDNVIDKSQFWLRIDQTKLNAQQVKVLNRLLDGDFSQGISSSQYQKVAKVSRATATRHLALLVELGCLEKTANGGRSTRYCATTL